MPVKQRITIIGATGQFPPSFISLRTKGANIIQASKEAPSHILYSKIPTSGSDASLVMLSQKLPELFRASERRFWRQMLEYLRA